MFSFGKTSRTRLATCHPDIKAVLNKAIGMSSIDFTVVCGSRDRADQDEAFNNGKSSVQWPNSKHNGFPSTAVDIAPYWPGQGIVWHRRNEFIFLAGFICGIAAEMGIEMRWGGNWDQDQEIITDQNLIDLPHLELVNPRRIT
jgi:peptidoglycan L-alanyl-D-glutamate endopeptidase CwlK